MVAIQALPGADLMSQTSLEDMFKEFDTLDLMPVKEQTTCAEHSTGQKDTHPIATTAPRSRPRRRTSCLVGAYVPLLIARDRRRVLQNAQAQRRFRERQKVLYTVSCI